MGRSRVYGGPATSKRERHRLAVEAARERERARKRLGIRVYVNSKEEPVIQSSSQPVTTYIPIINDKATGVTDLKNTTYIEAPKATLEVSQHSCGSCVKLYVSCPDSKSLYYRTNQNVECKNWKGRTEVKIHG